jgi:hypothetical protein
MALGSIWLRNIWHKAGLTVSLDLPALENTSNLGSDGADEVWLLHVYDMFILLKSTMGRGAVVSYACYLLLLFCVVFCLVTAVNKVYGWTAELYPHDGCCRRKSFATALFPWRKWRCRRRQMRVRTWRRRCGGRIFWIWWAGSRRTMSYVRNRISWKVRLLCWNQEPWLMDLYSEHLAPATFLRHRHQNPSGILDCADQVIPRR